MRPLPLQHGEGEGELQGRRGQDDLFDLWLDHCEEGDFGEIIGPPKILSVELCI